VAVVAVEAMADAVAIEIRQSGYERYAAHPNLRQVVAELHWEHNLLMVKKKTNHRHFK